MLITVVQPTAISYFLYQIPFVLLKFNEDLKEFLKVKVLLAHSCPTLWDPMGSSLPGSFFHGILQARILEWVAFPPPGDLPNPGLLRCRQIFFFLTVWAIREDHTFYIWYITIQLIKYFLSVKDVLCCFNTGIGAMSQTNSVSDLMVIFIFVS